MANLSLWNQVDKTNPAHTKEVKLGRKFTAIDAHYQVMRATEVFGPCGQGWGIRNSHYQVLTLDAQNPHYSLLQFTAQLWYNWDGQEGVLDIAADIELFEDTRNGWKRVEDSHKKVRTDAVTKGLSWLGFSADVFLGRFSDNKYVQSLQQPPTDNQVPFPLPPKQATYRTAAEDEAALKEVKQKIWSVAKKMGLNEQALADTSIELVNVPLSGLTLSLARVLLTELATISRTKQAVA